jgi:hypothetical protein
MHSITIMCLHLLNFIEILGLKWLSQPLSLTPIHSGPKMVSTTSLSQPDVQLHQDGHGHEPLPVEGLF